MDFPSKARSTIKQSSSKKILQSDIGSSVNQNMTASIINPTSVSSNNPRIHICTEESTRICVELPNPPICSCTDPQIIFRESVDESFSSQERYDTSFIPSIESGSQPFLLTAVIKDTPSKAVGTSKWVLSHFKQRIIMDIIPYLS